MLELLGSLEDTRNARRKIRANTTCRIGVARVDYQVYEMSAHGFSFLSPKQACVFEPGFVLDNIAVANAEGNQIITGAGSVIHVTEFDYDHMRVGVRYTKKTLNRTLTGKIRVPRCFPRIKLSVLLSFTHNGNRAPIPGAIIDFTASTARIGFTGKVIPKTAVGDEVDLIITAGESVLLDTRAHVIRIGRQGNEIAVRFLDDFLDLSRTESLSSALQHRSDLSSVLGSLEHFANVDEPFKALVCDWRMYLGRLKLALDREEAKELYRTPSEQELFLRGVEDKIIADMMGYLRRFNTIVDHLPAAKAGIHKEYFRENLRPFLRASPLMAGIIDKEHGYSGDFETVKQFFQNPYRGDSLFGKMINKFHFSTDALLAHQERIDFLYHELCAAYRNSSEEFSFLSLGSGPSEEVLRFVKNNPIKKPIQAALLDGDAYGLADFADRLQYLRAQNFTADLINLNILDLLRNNGSRSIDKMYQMTYCAGLFDYLSQGICRRLVKYMINRTKEGGTLIVTNVHPNNEMRHYMDYCGGWHIIHRDEGEIEELVPPGYQTELHYDKHRTNIFLKVLIA